MKHEHQIFFNQSFDKKRLKALIEWVLKTWGEKEALRVVEELKTSGFHRATRAGISLGLHELTTPPEKASLISKAQVAMNMTHQQFHGARITATEKSQRIVDTWHRVSETLRKQVVDHFSTLDQLNPIYIMALSGARGNFSQVRQLVGMRGLMADPQGEIISFPIRSNLREGLTLTEYFISCSGARKGLVDTALRTADTGYLTRRLVDVSHHVVIKKIACDTHRGLFVQSLKSHNKTLLSLKERLVGRVLAENITQNSVPIGEGSQKTLAQKDEEISPDLAAQISQIRKGVMIRSPLTCALNNELCQLCYGWSLSHGNLVPLGEAVGVIAAQSIGEPGTQLTMRTFHTGGVFSGNLLQEIRAPHAGKISFSRAFQGLLIRTTHGNIAFLTKTPGELVITATKDYKNQKKSLVSTNAVTVESSSLSFQSLSMLFVRQGEQVEKNRLLFQLTDLSEQGNQPIKSQQTVFAELSGKVVHIQGGSMKNKELSDQENQENEGINQIEPEKSGRLGLFEILSTRIGARLNPNRNVVHNSILKTFKKDESIKSIKTNNHRVHDSGSHRQNDKFQDLHFWKNKRKFQLTKQNDFLKLYTFQNPSEQVNAALLQGCGFLVQRILKKIIVEKCKRTSFRAQVYKQRTGFTVSQVKTLYPLLSPLRKSKDSLRFTWRGTQFTSSNNKKKQDQVEPKHKLRLCYTRYARVSLQQKKSLQPYIVEKKDNGKLLTTFQNKVLSPNFIKIFLRVELFLPSALLQVQLFIRLKRKSKAKEFDFFSIVQLLCKYKQARLSEVMPVVLMNRKGYAKLWVRHQRNLHCMAFAQMQVRQKSLSCEDTQKQTHFTLNTNFYLKTIAEEGDLVNQDYKNYVHFYF